MAYIMVKGKMPLNGEIHTVGAKNAALPLFCAALLTDDDVVIKNCPRISDVYFMRKILERIGCKVICSGNTICINAKGAINYIMPCDLSRRIRSSIFMLGSVIGRFKRAEFTYPGGCEIGKRPIDLHLEALLKLGIDISEKDGLIICKCDKIKPAHIKLSYPSVGATENAMLAATLAEGITTIENAAREPEIVDLQNMLNCMGANITGAGQNCIIIDGVKKLHGCEYFCMPDRIAAGTYICAAAIAGGDVTVTGMVPQHIDCVLEALHYSGARIKVYQDAVNIKTDGRLKAFPKIHTNPYPGFPTDMQAQMCAVACFADGVSEIKESVFENRMKHIFELTKMGADICVKDNTAYITGSDKLYSANLVSTDLRGGAAMILAALGAEGESTISNPALLDRGYEGLESNLASLGADIIRIEE